MSLKEGRDIEGRGKTTLANFRWTISLFDKEDGDGVTVNMCQVITLKMLRKRSKEMRVGSK